MAARYPIERYLNARAASTPRVSSDGRWLAFLTDITGTSQIWRLQLGEGNAAWPRQTTFGAERVMAFRYSPAEGDGRLIYSRDRGGNEKAQLFLLNEDGTEICLTDGFDETMHGLCDWSPDGSRILYSANRRDASLFDLYVQDLDGSAAALVWENPEHGSIGEARFSPDKQSAVVVRNKSSFDNDLIELRLVDGSTRLLSDASIQARYDQARYADGGRSLIVTTNAGSEFMSLQQLDVDIGDSRTLVETDQDVEWMIPSHDFQRIAYALNVDGYSEVEVLDLATGERQPVPGSADGNVCGSGIFSADDSSLYYSAGGAGRTSDVFVWRDGEPSSVQMTFSDHGGIPTSSFVLPDLISYPTFDEREIPAFYYRPSDGTGGRSPVIVIVHGGPEGQSRPTFQGLIQYFVHSGFAVLVPNVRGSTGYGTTYADLDNVHKRMDAVADLAHAGEWLRTQPDVDPDRLVVFGGSYGGFMILSALTTYPDLWAAGVDIVGISSFVTFLENTSGYRRAHRAAEYGSLEDDREFLHEISPMTHVDNIRVPMVVIHGRNDPRVPLSEAEQLVAALRSRDIPVEFLVFDDEGHGVAKLPNRVVAYETVVKFLDRHLAK